MKPPCLGTLECRAELLGRGGGGVARYIRHVVSMILYRLIAM